MKQHKVGNLKRNAKGFIETLENKVKE